MNRELWDVFVEQVEARVGGDFRLLVTKYEAVTGKRLKIHGGSDMLFCILEQAMLTQHKELLQLTVRFIRKLPIDLQQEYQAFSRRRVSFVDSKRMSPPPTESSKPWSLLRGRTA